MNGDIHEVVFLTQRHGFVEATGPNYECRLKKALYGLKLAPCPWFEKLKNALIT